MKVLITGAGGQLGLDLLDEFADLDPVGLTHRQLDISDEVAVSDALLGSSPDLVINAAAWTDVDGCEKGPDRAHQVNALGPWWLARTCDRLGATLVHSSTDYVFSGDPPTGPGGQPRGWTEHDPIAPINEYGRSKAVGGALVRETLAAHHIVRTAWLNGARGHNFVRTMLRLANEHDYLGVVDETGCPTFTRDLAAATRRLADSGRYGTIHLVNSGSCTWYEFACATFEFGRRIVEVRRTSAQAYGRTAPRPTWSVIDDLHARTIGIGPLPPWRQSLASLMTEIEAQVDDS